MPENTRLSGSIDQIDVEFVEREATPRLLMKLGIQLHLAGLSLSNTVSILEIFGVERSRSTGHNWVHKASLQPVDGQSPDYVAVDETVIQRNDQQCWLYAAVDPETNNVLRTALEPTTNTAVANMFLAELRDKHELTMPKSSSMVRTRYRLPVLDTASISDTNATEIATASNVSFVG